MKLTSVEEAMLAGEHGRAAQKSMEILLALAKIYQAGRLIPVASVQISGVSYANLGEAGLGWLAEMADGGGAGPGLDHAQPGGNGYRKLGESGYQP